MISENPRCSFVGLNEEIAVAQILLSNEVNEVFLLVLYVSVHGQFLVNWLMKVIVLKGQMLNDKITLAT